MTHQILSFIPFEVKYISSDGTKEKVVKYEVCLTHQEIKAEYPYIVFEESRMKLEKYGKELLLVFEKEILLRMKAY